MQQTATELNTIMFSERARAAARRAPARARAPKRAGWILRRRNAWAPDDPLLPLWVLATLVDSGAPVYQRYVRGLDEHRCPVDTPIRQLT